MVSPVWEIFTRKDVSEKRACCSKCFKWISYRANTSSLIYHMANVHKISYESMKKVQQKRCKTMLDGNNNVGAKQLRHQQTRAYISSGIPFCVAENTEFRKFLSMLNPAFKQVSADTIRSDIVSMESQYREQLTGFFKNKKGLCLLSDGWQSTNAEFTLYCLVVACVDDNNKMHQKLVGVCDIVDAAADKLHESFAIELGRSGLSLDQFQYFVSDAGSNLKSLCDRISYPKLHCACHQLHLIVSKAYELSVPSKILEKARKIAAAISKSNKLKTSLRSIANRNGNTSSLPKSYSVTRWNGSRELLKTIKSHYGTLATSPQLAKYMFSGKEQQMLNFVLDVTEPIENCSIRFESDSALASEVLPHFKLLMINIQNTIQHHIALPQSSSIKENIQSFGNMLLENLKSRIDIMCLSMTTKSLVVLDPRYSYSKNTFSVEEWKECECYILDQFSDIEEDIDELSAATTSQETSSLKSLTMDSFLTDKSTPEFGFRTERARAQKEIEDYKKDVTDSRIALHANVHEFWVSKAKQYPLLSRKAKTLLAVPASSASTERIFSGVSRIVANKLRNRLSASTCSALLMTQAMLGEDRTYYPTSNTEVVKEDDNYDSQEEDGEDKEDEFIEESDDSMEDRDDQEEYFEDAMDF